MIWKIEVEKVENGYVIKHESDMNEDVNILHVLQEQEEFTPDALAKEDKETFIDLCWYLQEYFALTNSKHNKFNIQHTLEEKEEE